jgi:hypothetical protein
MLGSGGMNKKQIEVRLEELEKKLEDYEQKNTAPMPKAVNAEDVLKYFLADKQNTAQMFNALIEQVKTLRETVNETAYEGQDDYKEQTPEVVLSSIDTKIINFIQTQPQGMACADDVRKYMNYKKNNAACARLRNLEKAGLLARYQMGHKVYYAGKATMQLIVSPPQ